MWTGNKPAHTQIDKMNTNKTLLWITAGIVVVFSNCHQKRLKKKKTKWIFPLKLGLFFGNKHEMDVKFLNANILHITSDFKIQKKKFFKPQNILCNIQPWLQQ